MDVFVAVPPWAVLLIVAVLIPWLPRIVGSTLGGLATLWILPVAIFAPTGPHWETTFLGFPVTFLLVDDFTRLLGLGFAVLGTAAVWYAYASGLPRTTTAVAIAYIGTTMGVVFAGDWLTAVFFWELMAITSTVLVWLYGGQAVRAGYRYALAHGIGGSLVLWAVAWHYVRTESFAFGDGGIALGGPALVALIGIGVNCAFIGLHTWLPDTYPRPHVGASVFLSVFTTKTSAYVLYRAFPDGELGIASLPSGELLIAYMGGFMAVYGVIFALLQSDMRALLSYHIQAQVGYMVAGIGIGTAIGVAGAMGHLFNNILYKALLFMAVGVVILRTGENDLYKLGGMWKPMPITAAAFFLGAISITAVPGTNGFVSKGMVIDAANPAYYGASEYQALYWLLMIGAVGTFLSFIKLGYYVFLHGPATQQVRDATPGQTIGMLSIGALCIIFGVFWEQFVAILPGGLSLLEAEEVHPFSIGHLTDAFILLALSIGLFPIVRRVLYRIGHPRDIDRWINPGFYYTGRYLVLGVTDFYAAVDRLVVRSVRVSYWVGNHPLTAAAYVPGINVEPAERSQRPTDGGRVRPLELRASIGLTVLLVVLLVTLLLVLLL